MQKELGFLVVGVGLGFVLANLLRNLAETQAQDADSLVGSLDQKLDELERTLSAPELAL
jgi:uncharacterized membrane-anchored protein YhcB (DUF1043 family)